MEHVICVHKILDAVYPVALNGVDRIQDGDDNLERSHAGFVVRVLHNRNIGYRAGLLLGNLPVLDFVVPVSCIHAGVPSAVFISLAEHSCQPLMPHAALINYERLTGVQRVDTDRGALFLTFFIRQNHPNAHTANVHPVSNFLVLCILTLRSHELVQRVHLGGYTVFTTVGHILDWLTQQIRRLEGHDLVGPVHHNLVVDLRANLLLFQADVLTASEIIEEILHLHRILPVVAKSRLHNGNNVLRRNYLFVSKHPPTPMKPVVWPARKLSLICVF